MRRYRGHYIIGIICLIFASGGQLVIPQILKLAIDNIISDSFTLSITAGYMLWLVFTAVLIALSRFGWRHFIIAPARKIECELRKKLFDQLLLLSKQYYQNHSIGDIMARATSDLQSIRMATGFGIVSFIDGVFMTLAILIVMFVSNSALALVVIAPFPLIAIIVMGAGKLLGGAFQNTQEKLSAVSAHIQDSINGIRAIKAYVQEDYFTDQFGSINDEYKRANMRIVGIWAFLFPLITLLSGITLLLLLRFGGASVLGGTITLGQFVSTMSYLQLLVWPMIGAGFTITLIARGSASIVRFSEIINEQPEIVNPARPIYNIPNFDISIRNLSFRYPNRKELTLRDISLSIPSGLKVGILGRIGSGKSTLVNLLMRLLQSSSGSILLGGIDLGSYDLGTLRKSIAYAPQSVFLFSRSIRQNIAFSSDSIDEQSVNQVADIATITRDLKTLPQGYSTIIGERGVTLSGGQKQRISLARALLPNAPIMILDDTLSAVDTETEENILTKLMEYRKNKTTIIISHRVSTLKDLDQIFVLDHGVLTQSGHHSDLIKEDGIYRTMYTLQSIEEKNNG